ncbi:MAG TPA: xanthine dehydrogenase family protein subunit M [Candidatus Limnocylindrales bacterium]|nr:xanthine dehydrogenase family protein subunit M [Candidatus Limnocylindrales bacterium]
MYPSAFEYLAVRSFDEAIEALGRFGAGAKVLAGGASLIPLMKLRLAEPSHLVDINRIPDASYVRDADGGLVLGPLLREADLEASPLVRERFPILLDTTRVIADPIVRNMGTVVGNLAHGDPANDHPAAMLALGAELILAGPTGRRSVAVDDFFVGLFETALAADEVVVELRIPAPSRRSGGAYVKFERQVGDFGMAGAAVVVSLDEASCVAEARIALTNAGPTPIRATAAEALLAGRSVDDDLVRATGEAARQDIEPWADLRGGSEFKRRLAGVAVERALRTAVARARGGSDG